LKTGIGKTEPSQCFYYCHHANEVIGSFSMLLVAFRLLTLYEELDAFDA